MKRLIVIDDDLQAVAALRLLLEMDGFEVTGFTAPAEGLAALHAGRADLVITDLSMPGVHGREIVRAARRAGLPVLVVTAFAGSPAATESLSLGAARVIAKPVDYEALRAWVTTLLAGE